MDPESVLLSLAEIAVGLAGFSSIIVVFRRGGDDGAWRSEDVFRFRIMLESSLMAGLLALAPAVFSGLGLGASAAWPASSMAFVAYSVWTVSSHAPRSRELPKGALHPGLARFIRMAVRATLVLQVLNVIGWPFGRGPGLFVVGVIWTTTYAGIMFFRLVMAPIEERQPDVGPDGEP